LLGVEFILYEVRQMRNLAKVPAQRNETAPGFFGYLFIGKIEQ
jgi:hypothetical protein